MRGTGSPWRVASLDGLTWILPEPYVGFCLRSLDRCTGMQPGSTSLACMFLYSGRRLLKRGCHGTHRSGKPRSPVNSLCVAVTETPKKAPLTWRFCHGGRSVIIENTLISLLFCLSDSNNRFAARNKGRQSLRCCFNGTMLHRELSSRCAVRVVCAIYRRKFEPWPGPPAAPPPKLLPPDVKPTPTRAAELPSGSVRERASARTLAAPAGRPRSEAV